jgi:hypothetical protein
MSGRNRRLGNISLHNGELHDLYCSPNIIGVIKSIMRGARKAACMETRRNTYKILVVKLERKSYLEDLDGNGGIVLTYIYIKDVGRVGINVVDLSKDIDK